MNAAQQAQSGTPSITPAVNLAAEQKAQAGQQGAIAGYYTVVAASAEHAEAPERMKKGLARHPIPILVLARLTVDLRFQGAGLGAQLVRDFEPFPANPLRLFVLTKDLLFLAG